MEKIRLGSVNCHYLTWAELKHITFNWLSAGSFHHLITLNPEMVVQAEKDPIFRQAALKAELAVPDGAGLLWAKGYLQAPRAGCLASLMRLIRKPAPRLPGVEILLLAAAQCAELGRPVYLLGGTGAEREGAAQYLERQALHLKVYRAPDAPFSLSGPPEIIADIVAKQPGLLAVAYGAPKQAVWIERQRSRLGSTGIVMGVGGAFMMLSGQRPRAPRFLRKHNLEWLWRLLQEPKRAPRIFRAVVQFSRLIRQQKKNGVK